MIFDILILILLMVIAYVDARERRIPNLMVGVMFGCVLMSRMVDERAVSVVSATVGGLGIALFLLLLTWIRPGSFGLGDVKLMLIAGFYLGTYYVWYAFAIGIIVAAIFCIIGLLTKNISLKSEIPFGPFLCIGIAVMMGL